jgi:hypothetical protein
MVLLALPPADMPSRRRRMMANVRARLLKIPAEPGPELRIPALQLKREWSPGPEFGSDHGNPRELGWCRSRKHPAEILAYARAAYAQRRSSNANSLQSQNSAGFRQICATSKG